MRDIEEIKKELISELNFLTRVTGIRADFTKLRIQELLSELEEVATCHG